MNLRLLPTDTLSLAVRHLITDWRFMATHGWTKVAYVKRYGTTTHPKLGDGGPLIWQADVWAHERCRRQVIALVNPSHGRSVKRYHRIGWKLYLHMRRGPEAARWEALLTEARKVKDNRKVAA